MSSVFKFKQFAVNQGSCAMKINTDGVLLGAFAVKPNAKRILDIGTGTGVIALMLAQNHEQARVDAVDIDEQAYLQAKANFQDSGFAERLAAFHCSFDGLPANHADAEPKQESYDLIVSNPPFYVAALQNPDERRRLAKHAETAFFERLVAFVAARLSADGIFTCILPAELAQWLVAELLPKHGLHLVGEIAISSFADSECIRKIISIGRAKQDYQTEAFAIYADRGVHSAAYRTILKPFFLAF